MKIENDMLNHIKTSRNIIKKDVLLFKNGMPYKHSEKLYFCRFRALNDFFNEIYIEIGEMFEKFIKQNKTCEPDYSFVSLLHPMDYHFSSFLLSDRKIDSVFSDCVYNDSVEEDVFIDVDIFDLYNLTVPLFIYKIILFNHLVEMRQFFNINDNDNPEIIINENNSKDIINIFKWFGFEVISEKTSFYKPDDYKIIEFELKIIPSSQIQQTEDNMWCYFET